MKPHRDALGPGRFFPLHLLFDVGAGGGDDGAEGGEFGAAPIGRVGDDGVDLGGGGWFSHEHMIASPGMANQNG